MSTPLRKAMDDLITVFHHYSAKEGDKYKLNKAELKNLLEKELPEVLEDNKDSEVNRIMTALDTNKDGEVDFKEFVTLVAGLTVFFHEFFKIVNSSQ